MAPKQEVLTASGKGFTPLALCASVTAMRSARFTVVASVTVLLASCSASLAPVELSGPTLQYQNDLYGYAFEYPETLEIESSRSEVVGVSVRKEASLYNLVDLRVLRTPEMIDGTGGDTADRLKRALLELCRPSEPFVSVYCTDVKVVKDVRAANGMSGTEFRFTQEETQVGERTERDTMGPVIVYDISQNLPEGYAYLAIGPSAATPNAKASEDLVRSIAKSMTLSESPKANP